MPRVWPPAQRRQQMLVSVLQVLALLVSQVRNLPELVVVVLALVLEQLGPQQELALLL